MLHFSALEFWFPVRKRFCNMFFLYVSLFVHVGYGTGNSEGMEDFAGRKSKRALSFIEEGLGWLIDFAGIIDVGKG